jgi:hypothetical protein
MAAFSKVMVPAETVFISLISLKLHFHSSLSISKSGSKTRKRSNPKI